MMDSSEMNIERRGKKNVTYEEARVYLDHVSKYGSVLGLDAIRELLRELGDPQMDLKFIHIAGTNGKGSVLACTSTILSEAGYRTGRYISPTVISYLERIQVDGVWISEAAFARLTKQVKQAIARMEEAGKPSPTIFEVETAIAFLYFRETQCDLVVLECGLGGQLDATNIIPPPLCAVFTSIGEDHLGVLGNTIEEIAADKAGIIKPGCQVISAAQSPAVTGLLKKEADRYGCPFYLADGRAMSILSEGPSGITFQAKGQTVFHCPLAGRYQTDNFAVILELIQVLRKIDYTIPDRCVADGFMKVTWPGRFTCLSKHPYFFADGAHNVPAALRLSETLRSYFPGKRFLFIMGVFRDKEYDRIAKIMAPLAKAVYTVPLPDTGRTLPAHELARIMAACCPVNTTITSFSSIQEAVSTVLSDAGKDDVILAFGSLSYLGEVIRSVQTYQTTQSTEMRVEQ